MGSPRRRRRVREAFGHDASSTWDRLGRSTGVNSRRRARRVCGVTLAQWAIRHPTTQAMPLGLTTRGTWSRHERGTRWFTRKSCSFAVASPAGERPTARPGQVDAERLKAVPPPASPQRQLPSQHVPVQVCVERPTVQDGR